MTMFSGQRRSCAQSLLTPSTGVMSFTNQLTTMTELHHPNCAKDTELVVELSLVSRQLVQGTCEPSLLFSTSDTSYNQIVILLKNEGRDHSHQHRSIGECIASKARGSSRLSTLHRFSRDVLAATAKFTNQGTK
ncbi:hypothetical protein SNOG_13173 [Parastagonospora nodorum SN15]|uniref:Uncharacterized protein n=1 Tax=Phaeosphaeria nodorum (strain SN15 / ATCC MYA-4574 / FGSC 10173) TaxID=321614 RepID=Q0U4Z1_PHANO|nr:hypothetical protein SNOG_13173 [Parastagonospora nodorum SN15]EAT79500.1 hypothetical protein SNOG_13173 [Parastagonospora nodorum SN15]